MDRRGASRESGSRGSQLHAQVAAAQVRDVLRLLLVFRFVNALALRTFFQPDEYFQALEPAWAMAFGSGSGAWLTWEWQHQLRSSLHPAIFALAYRAVDGAMAFLDLFPPFRAFILVALPRVLQSVFAALADFFTWKLAMDIYGRESNAPWAALWMTVLSPWQWYCATRTFSNSLETTLTVAAMCYWPWELLEDAKTSTHVPLQSWGRVGSLRIALVLAAVAVLLRPTNLLIWLTILALCLTRLGLAGSSPVTASTVVVLVREVAVCGAAVLAVSLASDRLYFGFWTFPPYKWLYFNISQSLAVFYGHMPWHYYLSQGVPLLTTTFLPFALVGLHKSATSSSHGLSACQANILKTLSVAVLVMVAALSLISHKEVRFIYPLLPILHVLAAPYATAFFTTPPLRTPSNSPQQQQPPRPVALRHRLTLAHILSLNLLLAGYLSLFHQPAPISALSFLRRDFERLHPDALALAVGNGPGEVGQNRGNGERQERAGKRESGGQKELELFALFLTPCHSTPWRSHLVYPALRARALTCEPPLHTRPGTAERAAYLDEADRFYSLQQHDTATAGGLGRGDGTEHPGYGVEFLAREMWPPLGGGDAGGEQSADMGRTRRGDVPRYIVGFEGIEPVLRAFFGSGGGDAAGGGADDQAGGDKRQKVGTRNNPPTTVKDAPGRDLGVRLRRVWSGWNGAFNEDWRRRGRLVVWDTGIYGGPYSSGKRGNGANETTTGEEERVVDEL